MPRMLRTVVALALGVGIAFGAALAAIEARDALRDPSPALLDALTLIAFFGIALAGIGLAALVAWLALDAPPGAWRFWRRWRQRRVPAGDLVVVARPPDRTSR